MNWRYCISLIFCCFAFSSCNQDVSLFKSNKWEFKHNNTKEWSHEVPTRPGNYRLKTTIDIDQTLKASTSYSLFLDILASTNVFWDGVEIGRNGIVGTSYDSEIPGKKISHFKIPDSLLTVGKHEVELELSNFHSGNQPRFYVICAMETFEIGRSSMIRTAFIHIYAGCFLIIGLFYLVRYLTNRKRFTHLIFSLLSISFFTLIIFEYLRYYIYYDYSWHFTRLRIILGITLLIGLLLPLFFLFLFKVKGKWKILALILFLELLCFTFIPDGYDYATSLVMLCGFFSASLVGFYGIKNKKLEGILSIFGLTPAIITMLIWPFYYDYIVYIGFGNLTIIMLVLLAINDKMIREEKEKASLRSARLELELLKKNIQPHFMKNTLTSAVEWIERNPVKGTELIFALVEEFDLLLSISDKQLIPVQQEIDLCQKHLEIMSFRKEAKYTLITTNIKDDDDSPIPPAILLTVIENGITHNLSSSRSVEFSISKITLKGSEGYKIHCNGIYQYDEKSTEGTGTKYIKARLQESYPDAWDYKSFADDDGWLTTIQWGN